MEDMSDQQNMECAGHCRNLVLVDRDEEKVLGTD